eukprot:jgi/Pico_ML_1/55056/g809.t1
MSAWGAPVSSAWANADAGEDELPAPLPTLGGKVEGQDEEAFPSLDAAAKAPSRKKKTTQKMSLTDFQSGKFQPKPKRELTQAEIRAMLPTAPLPKDQLEAQEAAPNASGAYNRYDEVDNWSKAKKFQPTAPSDAHPSHASHADAQESWARGTPAPTGERPKLQLKPRSKETEEVPPTADVPSRPSIFGDAKPVVVKKLNLQPRSAETKASAAPTKSSIFGGARPREETLAEKGRDWRKEDLALEHKTDRKPSKEEKSLSAQIELLKKQVEDGQGESLVPGEEGRTVSSKLSSLELELAKLTLELDDKVRFSKGHSKSYEGEKDHVKQAVAGSNGTTTPDPEPLG